MAEWLYEDGIGERRAVLVENTNILVAEVERDSDGPAVGSVLSGRLIAHDRPRRRAAFKSSDGIEALIASPPAHLNEGAAVLVRITRMAMNEAGRIKLPLARTAAEDEPPGNGPTLLERISLGEDRVIRIGPAEPVDRFETAGWSEIVDAARTGTWPFAGGALEIALTPAMTLIDVDGDLAAQDLAEAGARAACAAIRCLGIGGSIGIDFPTLAGRLERHNIDTLLDQLLPPPFEKTAMNGFGFVQIVRRRERPSLIERMQFSASESDAVALLRHAERAVGSGPLTLSARADVIGLLQRRGDWTAMLERRTGRPVKLVSDPTQIGAGHAQ